MPGPRERDRDPVVEELISQIDKFGSDVARSIAGELIGPILFLKQFRNSPGTEERREKAVEKIRALHQRARDLNDGALLGIITRLQAMGLTDEDLGI